jgi:hypothetical protein
MLYYLPWKHNYAPQHSCFLVPNQAGLLTWLATAAAAAAAAAADLPKQIQPAN